MLCDVHKPTDEIWSQTKNQISLTNFTGQNPQNHPKVGVILSYLLISSILHRVWDIARYWWKSADLNLPHLYLAPPFGVMSLEFRRYFWLQKTRVPGLLCDVVCVILGLAIFVELRIVTDGRSDRQTDEDN